MTEKPAKNMAASVRQRLLNLRESQGGDYNALLTQYAIERFLYRLSKSELADHFILKGAMLFRAWSGTTTAPRRTSICLAAAIHHRTLWRTRFDTSSPFP